MATIVRTEKINTTNGWGFAGWIGTRTYYSNGVVVDKGRNHFRHAPSSPHNDTGFEIDGELYTLNPKIKGPDDLRGKIFRHTNMHSVVHADDLETAVGIFKKLDAYDRYNGGEVYEYTK